MNDEFVEREYEEMIFEGLGLLKDKKLIPMIDRFIIRFVLPMMSMPLDEARLFYRSTAIIYSSENRIKKSPTPLDRIIRELDSLNIPSALREIGETMSKYFFRLMIDNDPHRKELLFAYNSYGRILLMIKKGIEDYNTRLN